MAISDNNLIAGASRVLQERLPPGWAIERVTASSRTPRLRITSKEGQSRELPVSALSRPDPRAARQIPKERPLLVTAPYLSQGVRETIEDEGASYVDQTGNVRLVLDKPELFIVTSGAVSNPWPEERRFPRAAASLLGWTEPGAAEWSGSTGGSCWYASPRRLRSRAAPPRARGLPRAG